MLVSDLKQSLLGVNERTLETTLGDLEVDADAGRLRLASLGEEFPLDEQTERALSRYLGVSKTYLAKCPPDLKAHNLNYWMRAKPTAAAVIEAVGDRLVTIHQPGLVVLPLREVADIITTTFDPNHEITTLIRNAATFHIDIVTPHHVEVPVDDRIADRTRGEHAVGDITHGGVRILASPTEAKPPQVMTYLHRLWCTNGCTSPAAEGTISLRGNTVDDVLAELEAAARAVMRDLDAKLAAYAALGQRRPPGSPVRFAYQLGREYGLPRVMMDRIIDRVQILPEDASLYDIQAVFTQMANADIPYRRMLDLQHLSGDLAFNTEQVTARCGTCERLLPGGHA